MGSAVLDSKIAGMSELETEIRAAPPLLRPIGNGARSLLDYLLKSGGESQAALTAHSELSQPQVARLIKTFHTDGLVKLTERTARGRGNPSVHVVLNPDFAYGLGVGMVGDAVSVALLDFSGRLRATAARSMRSMAPAKVVEALAVLREEVIEKARIPNSRIVGAGVGFSGFFVGTPARFNPPDKLADWVDVDVARTLAEPLGLDVTCDNDGTAAAIAESLLGIGRRCSNFAYLHLANGVGGGLIADGKPVRGHLGNAGEFGGVMLLLDDAIPNLDSLRDIIAEHGKQYATVEDMIHEIDDTTPGVSAWLKKARPPIAKLSSLLGLAVACEKVVIGGRLPHDIAVALSRTIMLPQTPVRNGMPFPLPRIVASELEGDPVAVGAAIMPLQQRFFL